MEIKRRIAFRRPNRDLAELFGQERKELIAAATRDLQQVEAMVVSGRLAGYFKIFARSFRAVGKYKVTRHFGRPTNGCSIDFSINEQSVGADAALDGLSVIRTSVPEKDMSPEAVVRNYEELAEISRAFRALNGTAPGSDAGPSFQIHPIRRRQEGRVRALILLKMLVFYVQWHMSEAWRPLLFADQGAEDAAGTPAMSFRDLLDHMATIVRSAVRPKGADAGAGDATVTVTTRLNERQQRALDLIRAIAV